MRLPGSLFTIQTQSFPAACWSDHRILGSLRVTSLMILLITALQYCERNLCCFGGHEVDGIDCTQCNCVIIGSLITHNTNGTHVGQGCKILVRHPGWVSRHALLCRLQLLCPLHHGRCNRHPERCGLFLRLLHR